MKKPYTLTAFALLIGIGAGIAIGSNQFHAASAAMGAGGTPTTYTTKPVTPGDPMSYVGTVGQCPFYEIAGDKGCQVPSYLTCNADWSVCTPKVATTPAPTPAPVATPAPVTVTPPTPVKKPVSSCAE